MDRAAGNEERQPAVTRLSAYKVPVFLVDRIALEFDLAPKTTVVTSRLTLRRNPRSNDATTTLHLDGEDLELRDVQLDGKPLKPSDYEVSSKALSVHNVPDQFELQTTCQIAPEDNTKLEGLYQSGGIYCTQCEAEGFRRITYYPDRPDVMAVFTTTIRADRESAPILLSNGNLIDSQTLKDGRHTAVWHDPFPKPAYLFALVGGRLDVLRDQFKTMDHRTVDLNIYVDPGNADKCHYAMQALKRSMAWDEQVYGLAYDLDLFNIVAIQDFNMGAMENKSLNIFNAKYILADPETATDTDYAHIEAVVAHEYFHNWTGNRVTCRDWFQLSLKEGLTVFRDQEFSADMRSRAVKRIQDVRALRAAQFPEDAGPLAHPVRPDHYIEINNFYTPTVYEKGAEVIRMIHCLLGPERFRKGIDLYFERHDGQAVTCEDFVAAMADASGINLDRFQHWYHTAGTPVVRARSDYDAEKQELTLHLNQSVPPTPGQKQKPELVIPLAMGLVAKNGAELQTECQDPSVRPADSGRGSLIQFDQAEKTLVFTQVESEPVISLNRGFSAPIRVDHAQTPAERSFLMAHDSDLFQRWETGQQAAVQCLLEAIDAHKQNVPVVWPRPFVDAMQTLLEDPDIDPAFLAEAMVLPSEAFLSEQQSVIDVDGCHRARTALKHHLATTLTGQLKHLCARYRSNAPYAPDHGPAAERAVRNAALAYLSLLDDTEVRGWLLEQYHGADNMTDRWAALDIIIQREDPDEKLYDAALRHDLIQDFYQRYESEALVVDKWFRLQAMAPRPDILEQLRQLEQHAAFSIKAPNKVRALYGAFAAGNPVYFHQADGAGYDFVSERVIRLNDINPQIAARLAQSFSRWRRFDPTRQYLMKAALSRIGAHTTLSADVYEIVERALNDAT